MAVPDEQETIEALGSESGTFVDQYNRERPHQALAMSVPADLYARSSCIYRGLEDLAYPFHDHTIAVTRCGRICFKGRKINSATSSRDRTMG